MIILAALYRAWSQLGYGRIRVEPGDHRSDKTDRRRQHWPAQEPVPTNAAGYGSECNVDYLKLVKTASREETTRPSCRQDRRFYHAGADDTGARLQRVDNS